MKTSKLLAAAVLAAAVGAPIAGLIGDLKGQPMTSNGLRTPFLHSLPSVRSPVKTSWHRSSARTSG